MTNTLGRADDKVLFALAPSNIPSYRSLRYDGGDMSADLDAFPQADHALLSEMYAVLTSTFTLLREHEQAPQPEIVAELRRLYDERWQDLLGRVRVLGADIPAQEHSARIGQIVHDLKGGAFQALSINLQLVKLGLVGADELHRMFFLARDQLKIMRNALPMIDLAAAARDAQQRLHAIELLVEKWERSHYRLGDQGVTIEVDCRYSGAIAERCLEFSALDRVLYNLINNATNHTSDGRVELIILPIPADAPHQLRLIVANSVTPAQQHRLANRFPNGPGALFFGGYTTGGSGLGLRICADFICNAYGLGGVEQGLAEGHFGAALHDERFLAWVHWPLAGD